MPISAQYTWNEKKDLIKLCIPLKGFSPSKVDIIVSASTIKVNFSPYLLDIVLFKEINSLKHKAAVKDGQLNITLYKKDIGIWGALVATGDSMTLAVVKQEALAAQASLDQQLELQRKDRKIDEEKHALRKQMKLDEIERNLVDSLKQEEKETAEKEVYEAFAELSRKQESSSKAITAGHSSTAIDKGHNNVQKKKIPDSSSSSSIDTYLQSDNIDDAVDAAMEECSSGSSSLQRRVSPFAQEKVTTASTLEEDDKYDGDDNDGIDYNHSMIPSSSKLSSSSSSSSSLQHSNTSSLHHEYDEEVRYIPPPRSTGLSDNHSQRKDITFTPRVFPTPMRESKAAEEEDWVAKNRRHLKKHGVLGKGATGDITEEDPVWLKAKGDDFFRAGDVRSALNAYNAALDLDESMLSCLSNRAVCHLRLGMSTECKMDCTKGIDFILEECRDSSSTGRTTDNAAVVAPPPPSSSPLQQSKNGALLVKLYMRRGAASCLTGSFTEALVDYHQASSKYQQLNMTQISSIQGVSLESLAIDIQRLKLLVDADSYKKQGDSLFAEKSIHEAKIKYDQALALVPVHVSCLSNRAACSIALDDYNGCIEDCSTAISLLRSNLGDQMVEGTTPPIGSSSSLLKHEIIHQQEHLRNMLAAILPHEGSEKRKSWLMKTVLRRGVALIQMNRHRDALKDYQLASSLDPSNEAIRADAAKLYDLIASSEQSVQ